MKAGQKKEKIGDQKKKEIKVATSMGAKEQANNGPQKVENRKRRVEVAGRFVEFGYGKVRFICSYCFYFL